jgi:hypothetical protein
MRFDTADWEIRSAVLASIMVPVFDSAISVSRFSIIAFGLGRKAAAECAAQHTILFEH